MNIGLSTATLFFLFYVLLLILGIISWRKLPLITLISTLYACLYGVTIAATGSVFIGMVLVSTGLFLATLVYRGTR